MRELPTRKEAQESADYCDWIGNSNGRAIVEAYARRHLHTHEEVRAVVARAVDGPVITIDNPLGLVHLGDGRYESGQYVLVRKEAVDAR